MKKNKKRVLIKLSGEAFLGKADFGFDYEKVNYFAKEILNCSKEAEVAVVVGAGNLWRYKDNQESGLDRVKSDNMGMMATVMNTVMLSEKIKEIGGEVSVYSPDSVSINTLAKLYNSTEAKKDLEDGKIVFCAGGTGSPFFTTDSASALRAAELSCDKILKATKVDGVYDSDPNKNSNAKKFDKLTFSDCLENGLKVMDQAAFAIAQEAGTEIFIFQMDGDGNFEKALNGDFSIGTLVTN